MKIIERKTKNVKVSGREVQTIVFHDEPNVFYVRGSKISISGPFEHDDSRFEDVFPLTIEENK